MILRRLHVERFGRFREDSWQFGPGLNVIRGPNEAGKSTMREAIVRVLFDPTKVETGASKFLAQRTWGCERDFALHCEFTAAAQRWELTRDFEAQRIELRCDDGGVLTDDGAVNERLAELLGVHSREVYETTACLRQGEFARLEAGERVSELLQQRVAGPGARTGVQSVLDELDEALGELTKGLQRHAKSPGALRATMNRIEQLREQAEHLRPIVRHAEQARETIARLQERREEVASELHDARALRERVERHRELSGELAELRDRCTELEKRTREARNLQERIADVEDALEGRPDITRDRAQQIRDLVHERDELAGALPERQATVAELAAKAGRARERVEEAAGNVPDEASVERVRRLDGDVERLAEEHERASEALAAAQRRLTRAESAGGRRRTLLAIAATVTLAGIVAGALVTPWLFALAAVGAVVAIVGAATGPPVGVGEATQEVREAESAVQQTAAKLRDAREELTTRLEASSVSDAAALEALARDRREALQAAREEAARAETAAESAREEAERERGRLEVVEAKLTHRVAELGEDAPQAVLEMADRVFELREELAGLRKQLGGVLGDQTLEELDRRFSEVNSDRRGVSEELQSPEMLHAELDADEYQELLSRIERLEAEAAQIEEDLTDARAAAAHPEADPEELRRLEERLAAEEERLARVQERHAAMQLARDLLAQAHRETMSQAIDVLQPRTSELLSTLTCGRYATVNFDRSTLQPRLVSEEKGERVDLASELSCATREQLYLAARLALTQLLWPERCPPIMLDDPLVNFDPARRAEALTVIRHMAEDTQVLLFTCAPAYDSAADHLIELTLS